MDGEYMPKVASELCNKLLVTCYMGTENSSKETKNRAATLAAQIGRQVTLLFLSKNTNIFVNFVIYDRTLF